MSRVTEPQVLEGEWECMDCGYIEEGSSNRRPKACPECKSSGAAFEFFEYEEVDDLDDDDLYDDDDSWDDDDDDDDDDDWD
ncbi:MAG: hypothetical protein H6649_01255 [Caldilineae bacterium]|nr:hypothetical protein [Anaerolineae bacterium]MCB0204083.1 hypothetical protein [Anaerolineae bacterium]MCB9152669.1 hypothetical protein [Caldilineae bacterium]